MNKKEVYDLLEIISEFFPGFLNMTDSQAVQKRMDAWHKILQDYEFEQVESAVFEYCRVNDFPPKISQIIKGINKQNESYIVPNLEQTRELFNKWDKEAEEAKQNPLSKDDIQKILKENCPSDFYEKLLRRKK